MKVEFIKRKYKINESEKIRKMKIFKRKFKSKMIKNKINNEMLK